MSGPFRIYSYEVLRMVDHFRSTNLVSTSSAARSFLFYKRAMKWELSKKLTLFIYLCLTSTILVLASLFIARVSQIVF